MEAKIKCLALSVACLGPYVSHAQILADAPAEKVCPAGNGGSCCAANRTMNTKNDLKIPKFVIDQITAASQLPGSPMTQKLMLLGTREHSQKLLEERAQTPAEEILLDFRIPHLDNQSPLTPFCEQQKSLILTAFALGMKNIHGYQPLQAVPFFQYVAQEAPDSPMGHLMLYDFYRSFNDLEKQGLAEKHLGKAREALSKMLEEKEKNPQAKHFKSFDSDTASQRLPEELWMRYIVLHGKYFENNNDLEQERRHLEYLRSVPDEHLSKEQRQEIPALEVRVSKLAARGKALDTSYRLALSDIIRFERQGVDEFPLRALDAALLLGHNYYEAEKRELPSSSQGLRTPSVRTQEHGPLRESFQGRELDLSDSRAAASSIYALLEDQDNPIISRHPGLAHYRIHLNELPENNIPRVINAAQIIAENGRGIAHYFHMAAHIYHDERDFALAHELLSRSDKIDSQTVEDYLATEDYKDTFDAAHLWNHLHNLHFRAINSALHAAQLKREGKEKEAKLVEERGLKDLTRVENIVKNAKAKKRVKQNDYEYILAARGQFHRILRNWEKAEEAIKSYHVHFGLDQPEPKLGSNSRFHAEAMLPYTRAMSSLSHSLEHEVEIDREEISTSLAALENSLGEASELSSFRPERTRPSEEERQEGMRIYQKTQEHFNAMLSSSDFNSSVLAQITENDSKEKQLTKDQQPSSPYPPSAFAQPVSTANVPNAARFALENGEYLGGPLDPQYAGMAYLELKAIDHWLKAEDLRAKGQSEEAQRERREAFQHFQQAVVWEEFRVRPIGFDKLTPSLEESIFLQLTKSKFSDFTIPDVRPSAKAPPKTTESKAVEN